MSSTSPDSTDPAGFARSAGFTLATCRPDARCENSGGDRVSLTCAVRYGALAYVGEFRYAPGVLSRCGARVVVQTNRGIEIGQVLGLTCTGCENSIKRESMIEYARVSGNDFFQPKAGRILREATPQDTQENARLNEDSDAKLAFAQELARTNRLDMKFVVCEHLFGGERIIFHFMSENRVDFRDLVRDLAHEYHTRIEMHQIGSRDEARLVADYEICGRECCCRNFLKKLRPVTMRMAKLQKATLDPSKVSGRCGRLRCCLRYEHEGYEELTAKLPRAGTRVRTERGIGTIKDRQVLTQLLILEYDEGGTVEAVGVEALLETGLPKRPPPPPGAPDLRDDSSSRRGGRGPGSRPGGEGRSDRRREPARESPANAPVGAAQEEDQAWTESITDQAGREDSTASDQGAAAEESETLQSPGADKSGEGGDRRGRRRRRRGGRGRRAARPNDAGGEGGGGASASGGVPPSDRPPPAQE